MQRSCETILGALLRKRNRRTPGQSLCSRKGRAYVESVALESGGGPVSHESLESKCRLHSRSRHAHQSAGEWVSLGPSPQGVIPTADQTSVRDLTAYSATRGRGSAQ
jgi:hypothetical protein